MSKRVVGNTIATVFGLAAAAVTMYFSVRFLKAPDSPVAWSSLVFSGIISGLFIFFVVWGHFQEGAAKHEKAKQG